MTQQDSPERFKHLYDTPVFLPSTRGAGYYKYKITSIMLNRVQNVPTEEIHHKIQVYIKRTTQDTEHGTKNIQMLMHTPSKGKQQGELILEPVYSHAWTNLVDYFLTMEASNITAYAWLKSSKQYKIEFKQIKTKYPEEFL